MKIVADNYAANHRRPGAAPNSISESMLVGKIGEDLRDLYRTVTLEALPARLADLAGRIDGRRAPAAEPG